MAKAAASISFGAARQAARPGIPTGADILDLIQESVFARDLEGRIQFWNAASEALYGWSEGEAVGRMAGELLRCVDQPRDADPRGAVMTSGQWDGEVDRSTKSGDVRRIRVQWRLYRDAEGLPTHIIETGHDVTVERASEVELARSEFRYRNLFQAMAASFWELDFTGVGAVLEELKRAGVTDFAAHFDTNPDVVRRMIKATRIVDVNEQTVALFGRGDKAELLGDAEPFWPDQSLAVYAASVLAVLAGETDYISETVLRTIDGREFDALFTASYPPAALAAGIFMVGVLDLSERKKAHQALQASEYRYRMLFQHMPVALWQIRTDDLVNRLREMNTVTPEALRAACDADPSLLDTLLDLITVDEVNRKTVEIFGGQSEADFVGKGTRRIWSSYADTFRRALEERLSGAAFFSEETQAVTLDGRTINILFTIAYPPDFLALGINLVGNIDITDRVNAIAAVEQLQAEFAHSARVSMLGELTASIAHEVNQPLAAISAAGEAGLRWLDRPEPRTDRALALMGRMVDDAKRASKIIGRIRDMAINQLPAASTFPISELVDEAVVFLRHELRRHGVRLAKNLQPGDILVSGDRIQLQQVVVNLLVNAIQALTLRPPGSRQIVIASHLAPLRISLTIDDNGPGFEAQTQSRLFDSFFTTKSNGMGMGLPISRSIIEAHGGAISAEPGPTGGARFEFWLPLTDQPIQS